MAGTIVPPPPPVLPVSVRLRRAAAFLGIASGLAVVLAAAVVCFVARADFLTTATVAAVRAIFAHGFLAAAAASSPIVAVLLVGYGYMQRAMRRRAAAARAAS